MKKRMKNRKQLILHKSSLAADAFNKAGPNGEEVCSLMMLYGRKGKALSIGSKNAFLQIFMHLHVCNF